MKIKNNVDLSVLENYGFEIVDRQKEEDDENYTISNFAYKFNIGHSRRGQHYYLLIGFSSRIINIFASKPDGDGTYIGLPDVLFQLIKDDLVDLV